MMVDFVDAGGRLGLGLRGDRWLLLRFGCRLAWRPFVVAELGAGLQHLLFELLRGRMNCIEEIAARPEPHQLMIVVIYGGLGVVEMALQGENDMRFALAPAVQQFSDL